jgi:hypothetical protein
MNTPHDLYIEATRRGLKLEPAGDKLAVIPKGKCPPDFAQVLRRHKRELLDWLETRDNSLTPDEVPWLHVARQILAGEFDDADGSTAKSLMIGLRSIAHPRCQQALQKLKEVCHAHQS